MGSLPPGTDRAFRQAVTLVALLNLAYFGIEFTIALQERSVALQADSIDFLEDAAINALILLALRWGPQRQAQVGRLLAVTLLLPTLFTFFLIWEKHATWQSPDAHWLGATGTGALLVNLYCAFRLVRFRTSTGSLSRAAFLSARNDALANIAIISAGLVTLAWASPWPDLLVGMGILVMNAGAAHEVWQAASRELDAVPHPQHP